MERGFVISSGMLILLLLGGTVAAFATGYVRIPEEGVIQIGGTTYGGSYTYITYEQYQSNGISEGTRVDLRDVAALALDEWPDVPMWCRLAGGTWHWEDSWVGCAVSGYPEFFSHCDSNDAVLLGAQQCEALGATATCNENEGVYCKY